MLAERWQAIPDERHSRPGWEMRFHEEWWHAVFTDRGSFDVVLLPIGIALGSFDSLENAVERAEDNARERALNMLVAAERDIRRSRWVLDPLSATATPRSES